MFVHVIMHCNVCTSYWNCNILHKNVRLIWKSRRMMTDTHAGMHTHVHTSLTQTIRQPAVRAACRWNTQSRLNRGKNTQTITAPFGFFGTCECSTMSVQVRDGAHGFLPHDQRNAESSLRLEPTHSSGWLWYARHRGFWHLKTEIYWIFNYIHTKFRENSEVLVLILVQGRWVVNCRIKKQTSDVCGF